MTPTILAQEIDRIGKYEAGELTICNHGLVWNLQLHDGKLLYAKDDLHPVRRLTRALKQHCSNWDWTIQSRQSAENQPWEYHLLDQGISEKQLSLIRAKLVIRSILEECLFELSSYTEFNSDWKPGSKEISSLYRTVALSSWEIQTVFNKAMKIQEEWQKAGLSDFNPTLAPILKQEIDSQTLPVTDNYLRGQFTIWDIAWEQEKSVIEVARSLMPLLEKGILQFQKIPDLPVPTVKQSATVVQQTPSENKAIKSDQKQHLIACIDDSPVLAHTLQKILKPAGYGVLSIPEPMRGFSQLIENKPDLILLDLLLPNADGYSICKFLRDTPAFKKTPIIILTARNNQINRLHAKLVGATGFLGKPPQSEELLQMLRTYLGK
ncbi:MAG: response regulator [Coleofasciculaceae cyanobacterium]